MNWFGNLGQVYEPLVLTKVYELTCLCVRNKPNIDAQHIGLYG